MAYLSQSLFERCYFVRINSVQGLQSLQLDEYAHIVAITYNSNVIPGQKNILEKLIKFKKKLVVIGVGSESEKNDLFNMGVAIYIAAHSRSAFFLEAALRKMII